MKGVGVLWDERYISEEFGDQEDGPMYDKGLNDALEYMSVRARERNMRVFVSHYNQYNRGKLKNAWYFDGGWKKDKNVPLDVVLDKFYFNEETKKLKYRIGRDIEILNKPEFEELCKDKLQIYELFPERVPRTFRITLRNHEKVLQKINSGKVVIKPRFGSGGEGVKVVDKEKVFKELMETDKEEMNRGNLLAQEFKDTSGGIPFLDVDGVHDLRIIVVSGNISYSFVRTPKNGYISNVSRGGKIMKVDIEELPDGISKLVNEVDKKLMYYEDRIYSVDLMYNKENRPWIVELNTKPGIKFVDEEVVESKKKLIDDILELI